MTPTPAPVYKPAHILAGDENLMGLELTTATIAGGIAGHNAMNSHMLAEKSLEIAIAIRHQINQLLVVSEPVVTPVASESMPGKAHDMGYEPMTFKR
jgi:hypothetical protein